MPKKVGVLFEREAENRVKILKAVCTLWLKQYSTYFCQSACYTHDEHVTQDKFGCGYFVLSKNE